MIKYFKVLSDSEFEKLKDAIALITVYIAGADGSIEEDEINWAEKITHIRSYSLPEGLKDFYKEVGEDFHDKVLNYIETFKGDVNKRNSEIANRLAQLNPILSKLDPKLGAELYKSFKSFAKHVAKSTGGFLGFFSIGPEEAKLLDLDMITPIEYVPEED